MTEDANKNIEKKSLGEILKQERMAQGLALGTIHEETKIPMDVLKGIEEGYDLRTLTPFYIKGFIKMYARYLNVSVEDVIDDHKPKKELPKVVKRDVMEDVDIQLWVSRLFTQKRKKQILSFLGILVVLFIVFKMITAFTHRKPVAKTPKVTTAKAVEPVKNIEKTEKVIKAPIVSPKPIVKVQSKEATVKLPLPPRAQTQAEVKPVTLTVRANKKGWLTVKVDGVTVFRSSIGEGEVETWMADEQIEISGNIINQIEFDLNGKLIAPLGRKDRRAKRVVITKDGLKVSQ